MQNYDLDQLEFLLASKSALATNVCYLALSGLGA
jgi:hypothetical protein